MRFSPTNSRQKNPTTDERYDSVPPIITVLIFFFFFRKCFYVSIRTLRRIQRQERDNKKQNVRLTLSNSPTGGQSPKRTTKFLSPARYVTDAKRNPLLVLMDLTRDLWPGWTWAGGTANSGRGVREIWASAGTARTWTAIRRTWAVGSAKGLPTVRRTSTRANNWSAGRRATRARRTRAEWAYSPRPSWSARNSATTICTWRTTCRAALTCCLRACFSGG